MATYFRLTHMLGRLNEDGSAYVVSALYASVHAKVESQPDRGYKRLSAMLVELGRDGATALVQRDLAPLSATIASLLGELGRKEVSCVL